MTDFELLIYAFIALLIMRLCYVCGKHDAEREEIINLADVIKQAEKEMEERKQND